MNLKPGWKTSEFYVAILIGANPYLQYLFGVHLSDGTVQSLSQIAAFVVPAIYVASRPWLKKIHVQKAANNPDPVV